MVVRWAFLVLAFMWGVQPFRLGGSPWSRPVLSLNHALPAGGQGRSSASTGNGGGITSNNATETSIVKSVLVGKSVLGVGLRGKGEASAPKADLLWPVNGKSKWDNKGRWQPGTTPPPRTMIRSREGREHSSRRKHFRDGPHSHNSSRVAFSRSSTTASSSSSSSSNGGGSSNSSSRGSSSSSNSSSSARPSERERDGDSGGVIFSSDFKALRHNKLKYHRRDPSLQPPPTDDRRRRYFDTSKGKEASGPPTQGMNAPIPAAHPIPVIQYNFLADSCLEQIEIWPFSTFRKGTSYLTRWWVRAKRWGLLGPELLQLEREHLNGLMRQGSGGGSSSSGSGGGGAETDASTLPGDEYDDGDEEDEHEDESADAAAAARHDRGATGRSGAASKGSRAPTRTSLPRGFQARLRAYCSGKRARVLVVGDVHGCVDELCDLLKECQYRPGDLVVLLGDLVAKGPRSLDAVRLAISIGAVSVRGNHDQEVLRQALMFRKAEDSGGSVSNSGGGNSSGLGFNPANEHFRLMQQLEPPELEWMAQMPFFIRSDDLASLFVHAGFQPSLRLRDQDPWVMMTMRSLLPGGKISPRCDFRHPWADQWLGPLTVYFGHDAARGLQRYSSACGLDTGCVYGGRLTCMLLPDKQLVSVPSRAVYQDMKRSRSYKSFSATSPLEAGAEGEAAEAGGGEEVVGEEVVGEEALAK